MAVWWDTDLETYHRSWAAPLGKAASHLSMTVLPPTQVLGRSAIDGAIESMKAGGADAILIVIGGPTFPYRTDVAVAAVRHRLPTVAAFKEFTRAGGLISYGPDLPALNRRGAEYVDRILKGATPGSLPIELPTRYELAVNTATARALGLTLPQALLLSADEVIA